MTNYKPPMALAGLRVLDLSRILAGPYAAQMLADLGADVVKVENPDGGDDTRKWGPPFAQNADGSRDDAAYFSACNRNKRSVTIDFSTEGGADLGETFHGHHDFQLSDDIIRKVHLGHYTHYSKSVVKRPNYYQIVEDIFAQGYIGGEGTEFFTKETLDAKWSSGELQTTDCSESLIAWLIPSSHTQHLQECIDITGKYGSEHGIHDDKEHFFQASGLAALMDGLQGLQPPNPRYLETEGYVNTLCFRGKQLDVQGTGDDRKIHISSLNKGHWGNLTYAGCMKVREGQAMYAKPTPEEKLDGLLSH